MLLYRVGQGFGQVGGEQFSMQILADGLGRFAAEPLDYEPVLEEFECFLNGSVGVVKLGKVGSRVSFGMKQRGRQDFFAPAGGEFHADEPEGHRAGQPVNPQGTGGAPDGTGECLFREAAVGKPPIGLRRYVPGSAAFAVAAGRTATRRRYP